MLKDGLAGPGAPESIVILKVDRAIDDVGALRQIHHLPVWATVERILDGRCCVCCSITVYGAVDGGADACPFWDTPGDACNNSNLFSDRRE